MKEKIESLKSDFKLQLEKANSLTKIEELRIKFLGKSGSLTLLMKSLKTLPREKRPEYGKLLNSAKVYFENSLKTKMVEVKEQERKALLEKEAIDITLPGYSKICGTLHPLIKTLREIENIFIRLGYSIAEGYEIETDYYNFEALNIGKAHPARDTQDTFFIESEILLRTQTSPVQIRTMEKISPPIKIIAPGKCFRRDDIDATHSPMFHQIEGLVIDKNITFADLKGTLHHFVREMFGKNRKVRFRPSFFPFTEPSAEVDIDCFNCEGKGCRLCKFSGYIEILGAGMVHPDVLKRGNVDPEIYTGFAFGMGLERINMLKYGVKDIRLYFENDIRFINQFK